MSKLSGEKEPAAGWNLFENYSPGSSVFDEMGEAPSTPRPYWRGLVESLERLGRHELQSRRENGRRIIREHGVSFNVYGDPRGMERPWGLDLVPLLLTHDEWARLEAGLVQRSRLLNLILADIYGGSQRLLRDGFLPPELVYANPGFLRPCRGMQVTSQTYLHFYACDLGRSPDGRWWVLSDRTQAPSGAGYAWENRAVVSRILPEQLHECRVQRLAGFFHRQRQMLFSLAPQGCEHPSVVLLTPGPHNEAYFEHAYLARNLGFPLVEGADLTVRERRVFLKTIEGLQPVDVIFRRLDDSFCDPLELRGDSVLGVSGLIEAARAGNVTIANALGTGLLESPAFLAFLPGLCAHLLGQELLLPSLATWWSGQATEQHYVTEHLDSLILKPAYAGQAPVTDSAPPTGRRQLAERRRKLLQLIQHAPGKFVAQERLKLSRAPVWDEDHFTARPVILRAFVACAADSFAVLPGGLTRTSKDPNELIASMQTGSESKDTWIVSNGAAIPGEGTALIFAETRPAEHVLCGIPSRAADHLFWLGRYTERLEQLLRTLRCVLGQVSGESGQENSPERNALVEFASNLGLLPVPSSEIQPGNGDLSGPVLHSLYDPDQLGGVRDLLRRIRSSASAVRDRFSGDTWRILGRLDTDARARPGRLPWAGATALIHTLVFDLAAFNGMETENMTRGRGWRFLDLGRRLERALSMVKLLQSAASVKTLADTVLDPVLEIADSVMTYRRQYFASPQWPGVLALLLRDGSNPRSLAFQVNLLSDHVTALLPEPTAAAREPERARIDLLMEALHQMNVNELAVEGGQGGALLDFLSHCAAELSGLSSQITSRYFSHTVPRVS